MARSIASNQGGACGTHPSCGGAEPLTNGLAVKPDAETRSMQNGKEKGVLRIHIDGHGASCEVETVRADARFWEQWHANTAKMKSLGYRVRRDRDTGAWQVERRTPIACSPSVHAAAAASWATDSDLFPPTPQGRSLLPFQRAGIAYVLQRRAAIIADPMGLGKTIQAIGCMQYATDRVLIICPAALRLNWEREVRAWDAVGRSVAIATQSLPNADVCIVNYDRAAALHSALASVHWDMIILDEAHYLKNPHARRTIAIWGRGRKREGALRARRWISLTGTPMMNRPIDLWTHLHAYDPDGLGADWKNFVLRYCNAFRRTIGGKTVWDVSGASHLEELGLALRATMMVRRDKSLVLPQLPPKTSRVIALDPQTSDAMRWIREERRIIADMGGMERAMHILRTPAALPQIHEMTRIRIALAMTKIESVATYVADHLPACAGGKAVVFCWHRDVAAALGERIAALIGSPVPVIDGDAPPERRQAIVDAFQADDTPKALVATMKSLGVGVTLTAAEWAVFAEESWSFADIEQAADRLHRIGSAYANRLLEAFPPSVRERAAQVQELPEPLTDRERDVLRLMARGLTYQQIASELIVSVNTVRYHVKSLYSKLQVNSRTLALARARELRLLEEDRIEM